MKTIILLLAVATLAAAAPKPSKLHFRNLFKPPIRDIKVNPNPRVIGGQEAIPHSIPYQVFLEVQGRDAVWYCGGTLISSNYVLTAAHCNEDGFAVLVTLGAHEVQEPEETQVAVTSFELTVHEDYDTDLIINNIGVIKLPEAVTLTDAIQPASLPTRTDASNTYANETARISGWGSIRSFDDRLSPVLNYVDVRIISNEECEEAFGDLPESTVCTSPGEDDSGSCNGDSGGPLMVGDVQVGIVGFGVSFCQPGYPSGFTRVTSFLDWIEEHTDLLIK